MTLKIARHLSLYLCLVSYGASAQPPSYAFLPDSQHLHEVTVKEVRSNNLRSTESGKLQAPIKDLPMSVSVIDRSVLDRQQSLRLEEVLQNVPGVYLMGTTGGYQQEIAGRGYAYNSSNTFKNGVRFNNTAMPELSAMERVEVLKGSAAILYGNVAAGGILNLVTRKPQFTSGGEVGMRFGSYEFYKPTIDVYGAIGNSKHVAYRVNTTYEKAGSYRDNVKSDRMYINPSLLYRINDKTDVLLEVDYLKDNHTLDYGTGSINYVIADIPRNQFLGTEWGYAKLEQQSATLTATHHFNDEWQLRNITGVQDFGSDVFGATRPNASGNMVNKDGRWSRGVQRSGVQERYYSTQFDLTGIVNTGFLHHSLLVGADMDGYNTVTSAYNAISAYDTINIYDLSKYTQKADIPETKLFTVTTAPIRRYGAYVQDLISVSKHVKVLAGVRYSHQQTGSSVLTVGSTTTETTNDDGAFTPTFGIVYQPTGNLSFFGSYTNSFTLNTGVDINGNALAPSYISQYEVGAKTELLRHLLTANVSVYRIINSNLAQVSLENGNNNSNIKELAGEVTSDGVELELQTRAWHGLSVIAGYSYNETRYTKSNTYIEGSRLRYNPNHTADASLYYQFARTSPLRGFNLGAGWYFVRNRVAGRSTRIQVTNDPYKLMAIPNYSLFDVSLGYTYDRISIRLKVTNIANELSYNVHDDNSVIPIAPRQFASTITYKF